MVAKCNHAISGETSHSSLGATQEYEFETRSGEQACSGEKILHGVNPGSAFNPTAGPAPYSSLSVLVISAPLLCTFTAQGPQGLVLRWLVSSLAL